MLSYQESIGTKKREFPKYSGQGTTTLAGSESQKEIAVQLSGFGSMQICRET